MSPLKASARHQSISLSGFSWTSWIWNCHGGLSSKTTRAQQRRPPGINTRNHQASLCRLDEEKETDVGHSWMMLGGFLYETRSPSLSCHWIHRLDHKSWIQRQWWWQFLTVNSRGHFTIHILREVATGCARTMSPGPSWAPSRLPTYKSRAVTQGPAW